MLQRRVSISATPGACSRSPMPRVQLVSRLANCSLDCAYHRLKITTSKVERRNPLEQRCNPSQSVDERKRANIERVWNQRKCRLGGINRAHFGRSEDCVTTSEKKDC